MKRNLAYLLLISMLASLTACGGEAASDDTTAPGAADTTAPVTEAETDRSEITDDLPATDLGGYKFRIIGRNDNFVYEYELGADAENGDVVNDAAFKRNQAVAERLNIEFERTLKKNGEITSLVRQTVLAGEDAYDLVINASYAVPTLATENLLLDWYNLEYVDFSKPWWSTDAMAELSVANHSYFAVGDATMSNIGIAMCIFYNKSLGEEYKLDNVYEVINSGKWTYDYFSGIVKDIHRDVNGDSVMDSKDLYGFGNNIGSTLQPFVFSLGGRFTAKGSDDLPKLSMNNENFVNIFERIYALHMENEGVYADVDWQMPRTMFANSQIVFNTGAVYHAATIYREMEDDFGILPFPKADEKMEKYYTCHDPNVSLLAIPVTAPDPDRTGLVIEAMAIESYKTLTPAFFETALQVKYSRDDETVQTLELIKDGTTFDFAILYGGTAAEGTDKLSQCMRELLKEGSKDFASFYAANAPAGEQYYGGIVKAYQALK